jgi:hypothetical protein
MRSLSKRYRREGKQQGVKRLCATPFFGYVAKAKEKRFHLEISDS